MTFHEVRLPEDIERNAVGGPGFKTTILQLASGFEQRNIDWSEIRAQYDISYGLMNIVDDAALNTVLEDLLNFFYVRQGRAIGFRFKDWADYRIGDPSNPTTDNQIIGEGDDSTVDFQIFKRYSSGGFTYDRVIRKPVNGSTVVLIEGVVQTETTDYTVDYTTGIITFVTPPASTGGSGTGGAELVQVAIEFDVPVRFDIDQLNINVLRDNIGSLPEIPLIEIRPVS